MTDNYDNKEENMETLYVLIHGGPCGTAENIKVEYDPNSRVVKKITNLETGADIKACGYTDKGYSVGEPLPE
jgi:hypothetical protein